MGDLCTLQKRARRRTHLFDAPEWIADRRSNLQEIVVPDFSGRSVQREVQKLAFLAASRKVGRPLELEGYIVTP